MPDKMRFRFSVGSLFWVVTAIATPLGLSMSWSAVSSLLVCCAVMTILWMATRRQIVGAFVLIYIALLPVAFFGTIRNVHPGNPYVRRYNERLEKIAIDARLVGGPEAQVRLVLGEPTYIDSGWDRWVTETGEPTPDAKFGTTYNYAPYWFFPFAKFQVHCRKRHRPWH
jgi:hypothetical protein